MDRFRITKRGCYAAHNSIQQPRTILQFILTNRTKKWFDPFDAIP
jgi:hypothetical protein